MSTTTLTSAPVLSDHSLDAPYTTRGPSCPQCGAPSEALRSSFIQEAQNAQARIKDLEAQVRLLNGKAAAAVDRLADYEDEARFLRSQQLQGRDGRGGVASPPPEAQPRPQQMHSRLSSLTSFIPGRRASPSIPLSLSTAPSPNFAFAFPPGPGAPLPSPSTPCPPQPDASSPSTELTEQVSNLTSLLQTEKVARLRAEKALAQGQAELEDLTAQLFGQANEMVAHERRARAKVEEKLEVLEKRDVEKKTRLELLEQAVRRVDRVRGLLG